MDIKQTGCGCLCWIAIIIGCVVLIKSCQSEPSRQTKSVLEPSVQKEVTEQEERDRAFICSLLCRSLKELYGFRYDEEFHRVGFGVGGKYHAWLNNIEQTRKWSASLPSRFLAVKAAAGEIMQAGFEFMKSGGFDTEYTKTVLPDVERAIGYKDYLRRITEIEAQMQK